MVYCADLLLRVIYSSCMHSKGHSFQSASWYTLSHQAFIILILIFVASWKKKTLASYFNIFFNWYSYIMEKRTKYHEFEIQHVHAQCCHL